MKLALSPLKQYLQIIKNKAMLYNIAHIACIRHILYAKTCLDISVQFGRKFLSTKCNTGSASVFLSNIYRPNCQLGVDCEEKRYRRRFPGRHSSSANQLFIQRPRYSALLGLSTLSKFGTGLNYCHKLCTSQLIQLCC